MSAGAPAQKVDTQRSGTQVQSLWQANGTPPFHSFSSFPSFDAIKVFQIPPHLHSKYQMGFQRFEFRHLNIQIFKEIGFAKPDEFEAI
ncbi:hypothetical protein AYI68_g5412 [Smittium mucronatum]|uniref:Uncharacterized protein n=1 Tax=Smittium mucronatum TaxID=133383 RepID=A0A1R0GUC2_9FUNG|nr:hypothetical protein AYI68_g5412 [Smittium mucronatum]